MRILPFAHCLFALAVLLAGCGSAAKLIPGNSRAREVATIKPTATSTAPAGPILVTPTLELGGTVVAASGTAIPDQELARSVVQLRVLDGTNAIRTGSGVVIDLGQRLILTSYPLVDPVRPDGSRAYTTIVVGTNRTAGADPKAEFEAEVVTADAAVDLAVLRVVRKAGAQPLTGNEFDLPAVRIDQSSDAGTGDPLRIFGNPGPRAAGGAGPQAVTVAQAGITGSRGAPGVSGRAWLKTDARLPYGTQGGPAFNRAGGLVGLLVQPVYSVAAPVAQVRPSDLAADVIQRARSSGPQARYRAPLTASPTVATGAIFVSTPTFAQNAIDGPLGRDLFDYRNRFDSHPPAVYYEFAAQGVPDGAVVEERWYRDGVFQDQLSSSYPWNRGGFGSVSDRLASTPAGLPDGRWRLEVWIGGALRATGTALVGVDTLAPKVTIQGRPFGATATEDRHAAQPATAGGEQLLFFFNYEGTEESRQIRWLVFYNGQVIYQSPEMPWTGGNAGSWWVGYKETSPLRRGTWEFELHIDGRVVLVKEVAL